MPDALLTVSIHDEYTIKTVDVNTGAIKNIRHVGGKIIQGPVITDDRVTVTVQEPSGKIGKIYTISNLFLKKTFVVTA